MLAHRTLAWLPVTAILGYWAITQFVVPIPFYFHYDPELLYSFSSLGVFRGLGYLYIDHPGTPVEILGSALYALTFPFLRLAGQPFFQFHVSHPEVFLILARTLLVVASAICAMLLFRRSIVGQTGFAGLQMLAVALLFFALNPLSFESLSMWSHNSFSFPFGTLSLLGLWGAIRAGRAHWKTAALLGFGSGVLASVQLYFATWTLGVVAAFALLYLLEKRRLSHVAGIGLVSLAASLLGYVIATLPVLPRLGTFFGYISQMLFHQGIYGTGPEGILSLDTLYANLAQLWGAFPVLFVASGLVTLAVAAALIFRRDSIREHPRAWSVALALSLQLLATLALVVKHPGNYYTLGVAAIFPVLLAVLFTVIGSSTIIARSLTVTICAFAVFGAGQNFINAVNWQRIVQAGSMLEATTIQRQIDDYARLSGKNPDSVAVLWSYGTPSGCYARMFGDEYSTNHAFGREVSAVCQRELQFNVWDRTVRNAAGVQQPENAPWDIIIANRALVESRQWGDYSFVATYGTVRIDSDVGYLIFVINGKGDPMSQ